ncbi:MAG: glycosyltransferase family 39 protein [Acetobacteraceae bacterium]|nr:glycosyltransferase family 39 protein [Acetobacteraceae bacterium]
MLFAVRHQLAPGRPYLCLIAFCLILWLPGFFTLPPTDRDEGRFAQASKQMLETHDYVNIRIGTEARNRKPVGIYWLQAPFAAAIRATGLAAENPIWPYRIPSVLGALLAVLALYHQGRRLAGDGPAWLAAAMLAASLLLVTETHIAKTDGALLGATTLTMLLLARAYLHSASFTARAAALFWIALGAGILLKGPVILMIAFLTVLTLVIADRGAAWLRPLRSAWGVPLMLLITLPWFIAIGIATEGRFFRDSLGGDLAGKLVGGAEQHWGPPGAHLLVSPVMLFPATIVVFLALPGAWRQRAEPFTRFLLAWIIPSWLVFEAVPTKLPHYVLPLYPALFLIAARWLFAPDRAQPGPRWTRFAVIAGLVAATLLGAAGLALPILLRTEIWRGAPTLLAAGIMLWLAVDVARTQDWPRLRRMILAMPLLTWAILEILLPALRPVWLSPRIAEALAAHYPQGRPRGSFATIGYHEPSLLFLAGTDVVLMSTRDGHEGAAFLAAAPGRTLLVAARQRRAFLDATAKAGLTPLPIAEISGFNYAAGRSESLTLYAGSR